VQGRSLALYQQQGVNPSIIHQYIIINIFHHFIRC
jgi:hypothetical protein